MLSGGRATAEAVSPQLPITEAGIDLKWGHMKFVKENVAVRWAFSKYKLHRFPLPILISQTASQSIHHITELICSPNWHR
jgi:hypothetical protein